MSNSFYKSKKKKEIKVYEGHNKKGNPVLQIKPQGNWLAEIGFNIGSVMEVEYETNKLALIVKSNKITNQNDST